MNNKYALVTGSSRGIGRATALQLADDGFNIFVHFLKEKDKAEKVKQEIEKKGAKAYLIQADVTKEIDRLKIVEEINRVTSVLDVLVNSVGFDYAKMIEDYDLKEIEYMINVNLTQKMMMTKHLLSLLKKSKYPSIVNLSSRMGKEKTIPTIGAYGPPEAGVIKFTQCCALEFAKYNIRVNCVAPGLTRTDLTESILNENDWEASARANPSHRVGQPEDIAKVVSFLVSDKSDYINGETIGVNGGSNLG